MAQQQQQQIEEPQSSKNSPQQAADAMPLKDQFTSDLSDIDLGDYADKQQEQQNNQKQEVIKPKKKKIMKGYRWKLKWVSQSNIIQGSKPIWIKKWVKVKDEPKEEVNQQGSQEAEKDKGALELAHAIIQGQITSS